MFIVILPLHPWLGYCFWYQLFCLWYVMLILAWIHLILSWFCDFALNTWFWVGFVLAPDISKCWVLFLISALLSLALHFILHISSIMVVSCEVLIKNIRVEKYHVSIWQLFLAKFAVKTCYVWQGLVVMILQQKHAMLCVSWH